MGRAKPQIRHVQTAGGLPCRSGIRAAMLPQRLAEPMGGSHGTDRTGGAGLIGQAWAIVFGRAGHEVMLYDAEPAA